MKRFVLSLTTLLFVTVLSYSQAVLIKNATPLNMTMTDFVYIDPGCTVTPPNFYGINEPLPNMSFTVSTAFHTSNGWKLLITDNLGNFQDLRDETPIGCGSTVVNGVPIGAYWMKWWYTASGDIFVYIF